MQAHKSTIINERVFRAWDYPLFALLSGLNIAAVAFFTAYWYTLIDWGAYPLAGLLLFGLYLLNLSMYESRWFTLPLMRRPLAPPARPGWRVGVATTFVPGAESIEMLEATVTALVAMDYPHDTWVLDEGDDERVKALCRRLGARHFSRRGVERYQQAAGPFAARTKHGNYNAWLFELGFERYDIITAFDPDHIPQPDFLTQVLGYFDDPAVGYVQAAQAYYNQRSSFIARGAAEETYAYYSSIQMTSYALGYPIITGCHNSHRASALREVGGFAPHEADDLLLTIFYRVHGWRGVYVPRVLARGLTPVDWRGYLTQQRRWARSVLDIKFRVYPRLAGRLPLIERIISFYHGLYYFHALNSAVATALLAYVLITGSFSALFSLAALLQFAGLWLTFQVCDLYRQRFFLEPRREAGVHWRSGVLRTAKWPYMLFALYDALSRHRGAYTITPKARAAARRPMLTALHLPVILVIGGAWIGGALLGRAPNIVLDVSASGVIVGLICLLCTDPIAFPDPYDPLLQREECPVAAKEAPR